MSQQIASNPFGDLYALYNRGANRQPIFFCEQNWAYFVQQL